MLFDCELDPTPDATAESTDLGLRDNDALVELEVLIDRACDPDDSIFRVAWERPLFGEGFDLEDSPRMHPLSPLHAQDAEVYIYDPERDPEEHERIFDAAQLDYSLIYEALNHPTAFFRICWINRLQKRDPLGDQAPENVGPADPTIWQERALMHAHAINALRSLPFEQRLDAVHELGLDPARLDKWYIVGKCRQAMMSTVFALGIILRDAMYFRGLQCVIAANSDEVATELFRRIRLAYRHLPACMKVPLDPSQKSGSERRMTFIHGGFIKVISLGGPTAGVGHAVDRILLTEWGEILDQERASANVFPAFNQRGNAQVYLESTWGKFGSDHQQKWFASLSGEGRFHPIFIPWWRLKPLAQPAPADFVRTAEEDRLAKIIREFTGGDEIDNDHLYFRRLETVSTFSGNYAKFDSKYPPSPWHGWLGAGNSLLPADAIADALSAARKNGPLRAGPYGIEIYEEPRADERYFLVADTAGYAKAGTGDPSALSVVRARDFVEVAAWSGEVLPEQMADIITAAARIYSLDPAFPCVVAIERAGGTISVLRDRNELDLWIDTDGLPGWKASKPSIERGTGRLAEALRSKGITIRSEAGLLELAQYDGSWKVRQQSLAATRRRENGNGRHHFDRARCYVIIADCAVTTSFLLPRRFTAEEAAERSERQARIDAESQRTAALRAKAGEAHDAMMAELIADGVATLSATALQAEIERRRAQRALSTYDGTMNLDPSQLVWGVVGEGLPSRARTAVAVPASPTLEPAEA